MDKNKLAEKIRTLRKASGLRQEDLAAKAGVSLAVIKAIESAGGNPTLESLELVLGVLRLSFTRLFADIEGVPLSSDGSMAPVLAKLESIEGKLDKNQAQSLDPRRQELLNLILGLSEDLIPDAITDIKALIEAAADEDESRSPRKSK